MALSQTHGYVMTVAPDPTHEGWVRVSIRKHWWTVRKGTTSRAVVWTSFHRGTMGEREVLETALREALLAYTDRLG